MNRISVGIRIVLITMIIACSFNIAVFAESSISINLSQDLGYPGDQVQVRGLCQEDQWLTLKVVDEDGNLIFIQPLRSDQVGAYETTFIVPLDSYGQVTFVAGYGTSVITKEFQIEEKTYPKSSPATKAEEVLEEESTGSDEVDLSESNGGAIKGQKASTDTGVKMTIDRESFDSVIDIEDNSLALDLDIAKIIFDSKALTTISTNGDLGDITLVVEEVEDMRVEGPVYDFTLMAGQTQISDFKGKANISIPYGLEEGQDPKSIVIYYMDDSGELKAVRSRYNSQTGAVEFVLNHFSKYTIAYNLVSFIDVDQEDWYYNAVTFCGAQEITNGIGQNRFAPEETITRGQFLVMLMRAFDIESSDSNLSNFDDGGDTYYTPYLSQAKALGITKGIGNNLFAPEAEITREDMFTLLYRTLDFLHEDLEIQGDTKIESFEDTAFVSDYALEAVELLLQAGVITGDGDKVMPGNYATRGEMAQVLYNILH